MGKDRRGVVAVNLTARWGLAIVVTVAAFVVPTLVCGVWVLVPVLQDSGTRWGVASGLGVAVAALAALWGHGFATGNARKSELRAVAPGVGVQALGDRAVAVGGGVRGGVFTGDGTSAQGADGPAAARRRGGSEAQPLVPGVVVASGERSVAIGGSVQGDVSSGNQPRTETP